MAPNLVRAQSAYKDIMIRPFHHTHIQTDTHTHTHTHTHARTHARAHARTHARTHALTHTHTHTTDTWFTDDGLVKRQIGSHGQAVRKTDRQSGKQTDR